ncbi:CKLF-like MARVEL transmembrane domain-containing protein 7 [Austrofundulus limnaeus]|uniref:CKLF-like MARVEL transmembrane domain-containing protein 7 n=1 Tax=Austrofundulus limnaeus TaxID=52670 RepID=A0A2I4AJW0_AUSLI|nr:PREDICTED: CKLF-like MARVEL transmembrane domain-containing protein 7 [Austrofundulus limnaeus]
MFVCLFVVYKLTSLPAAAGSLQDPSLHQPRPHPQNQDHFEAQGHRQQEQQGGGGPAAQRDGSGVQDVQGGLVLAQRVGGAAGVLLTRLHVHQLADGLVPTRGALGQRGRTLQRVVRAQPLDVRQWRALDPAQSPEPGLPAALHGQNQNLWRSLHPQSGPHLVLEADVLLALDLHPAVVAPVVLQGGAVDAQRQVVFPRVALQAVPLVLLGARLAGGGPGPAGAAVQDGGPLAVAQAPQHLQRRVLRVLRVAEGAGQDHRVPVHPPDLRLDLHGPAVVSRTQSVNMSHSVITTTPTGGRSSEDGVLNLGYTRTIPGVLKLGQLVSLLICFLCVRLARGWPSWAAFQFFEVVALWFFVAFLIFLLMHLVRLQGRLPCINWPLTEFFHYSLGAVLIFIASIVAAVKCGGVSALVVASVFGFIATFLMVVNLWTSYSVACGPQTES